MKGVATKPDPGTPPAPKPGEAPAAPESEPAPPEGRAPALSAEARDRLANHYPLQPWRPANLENGPPSRSPLEGPKPSRREAPSPEPSGSFGLIALLAVLVFAGGAIAVVTLHQWGDPGASGEGSSTTIRTEITPEDVARARQIIERAELERIAAEKMPSRDTANPGIWPPGSYPRLYESPSD